MFISILLNSILVIVFQVTAILPQLVSPMAKDSLIKQVFPHLALLSRHVMRKSIINDRFFLPGRTYTERNSVPFDYDHAQVLTSDQLYVDVSRLPSLSGPLALDSPCN